MDQEEKARLIRVDERTKYISKQLDVALEGIETNRDDIDKVEELAHVNATKINGTVGIITAVSTGILGVLAKLAGLLRF